jgi:hypothetical protein
MGIHALELALAANGMLHHEGLNSHGAPGIKHSQPPARLEALQGCLGLDQSFHNPLP